MNYTQLLTNIPHNPFNENVAEQPIAYNFFRERHLQAMWLEQKYFKNLTTAEGIPITVFSPGIWNCEAGPDFLKAHLKIGNLELRGDVELHLSEDSWYDHKHHEDERYDFVILHIGYWKPKKKQVVLNSKGKSLPLVHLEKHLSITESRILKLIDLDLYPYKHFVGSGTCAGAIFRKLPESKAIDFFRKSAYWRLIQKGESLQANIANPSFRLAGGVAMALGYKHNAKAFLEIFLRLTGGPSLEEEDLFACTLGWSGFFTEKYRLQWSSSPTYLLLESRFERLPEEIKGSHIILRIDRTRPANHPVRRLAALVKMISSPHTTSLGALLASIWQTLWPDGEKQKWKDLKKQLLALFSMYKDPYWDYHCTFAEPAQAKALALIGDDLKKEIVVNACLPLLYEDIKRRGEQSEEEAFYAFYGSLRASNTKKSTYLAHRFFGDSDKSRIFQRAEIQQGAYQLHRDFCLHFEASCVGCPFVERYKEFELGCNNSTLVS